MKQTIKIDDKNVYVILNNKHLRDNDAMLQKVNALVAKAVAENKPETFAWYSVEEALNELVNVYDARVISEQNDEQEVAKLLMIYRLGIPYMLYKDFSIVYDYAKSDEFFIGLWTELKTSDSDVRDEIARLQARITELQASLTN